MGTAPAASVHSARVTAAVSCTAGAPLAQMDRASHTQPAGGAAMIAPFPANRPQHSVK